VSDAETTQAGVTQPPWPLDLKQPIFQSQIAYRSSLAATEASRSIIGHDRTATKYLSLCMAAQSEFLDFLGGWAVREFSGRSTNGGDT